MAFTLGILIFYRFFVFVSILETIVAWPWLNRREMTWDDSPGRAIIDGGAAGFGALNQLWNQLIIPSMENEKPTDQIQSQPETSNTPEWSMPHISGPNMLKQCSTSTQSGGASDTNLPGEGDILTPDVSVSGTNEVYVGAYVQQNIKTG